MSKQAELTETVVTYERRTAEGWAPRETEPIVIEDQAYALALHMTRRRPDVRRAKVVQRTVALVAVLALALAACDIEGGDPRGPEPDPEFPFTEMWIELNAEWQEICQVLEIPPDDCPQPAPEADWPNGQPPEFPWDQALEGEFGGNRGDLDGDGVIDIDPDDLSPGDFGAGPIEPEPGSGNFGEPPPDAGGGEFGPDQDYIDCIDNNGTGSSCAHLKGP